MLDEWAHEAEQQREQQGRNVLPVDVGVGHQHDLVIAQLCDVELFVDARAERRDDRLDFGVLQHASMRAFSTLMIFPRSGRIAWYIESRPDFAEPPAESPSTM